MRVLPLISIFCLRGALEQRRVVTMALCSRPRAPDQYCGFLVMLPAPLLELQMPAEGDRVVFVLFVSWSGLTFGIV